VESIIDAEQNYLFTNDYDYLQNRTDIVPQQEQNPNPQPQQQPNQSVGQQLTNAVKGNSNSSKNSGSNLFVKEIRARIDAYFKLVVRNVRDCIPKTIGYFLVKSSQDRLQFELYA
jgi:vacuolar protein sorting-associated protein 1